MQAEIRRRLSTAARARDFATAHTLADPGFTVVLKRLDDTVTQADAIAMQQSDGFIGEHAAQLRRRDLKRSIWRNQLRRLVSIASLAAKDHPELQGLFVMPRGDLPNKSMLLAARAMLAAAIPHQDLLVSLGVGNNFIAELTKATDDLEGNTEAAHTGRSDHVIASTDLLLLARECRRDIAVIGTYYRASLPAGSEVLSAWAAVSKVPGNFRRQSTPTPPTPPAPASNTPSA